MSGGPTVVLGSAGDVPVPADYDGDGLGTYGLVRWGTSGDVALPGDYDGDGVVEPAVWRPSSGTWYLIPVPKRPAQ